MPLNLAAVRAAAQADAAKLAAPVATPGGPAAPASPAGTDAAPAPAAPAAPIDYHAEATGIVELAATMFFPLFPSLEAIYTDDARSRIAAAAAPLMQKYGCSLGVIGPELAFILTIAPFIPATIRAVKHDNAQAKAQAGEPRQTRQAAPAGAVEAQPIGEPADTGSAAGEPAAVYRRAFG